uniref:Protein-S-isoprenylcysteine O-methyltransferase n=1 Tax=Chenopodium quinoa TaxID=63459 RepID=A0A803LEW5_CHEQI
MICSLVEYWLEITFLPGLKEYWWISNSGLAMVVFGEIIRKVAMVTAGHAFTHLIKIHHEEQHRLVTHGIYGFVRHPGYCGFFIWSVGTQIMLLNPICTLAFAVVVWKFFAGRIPYEEFFLRQFFDDEYEEYAQRVPSGVPFVKRNCTVVVDTKLTWWESIWRFPKHPQVGMVVERLNVRIMHLLELMEMISGGGGACCICPGALCGGGGVPTGGLRHLLTVSSILVGRLGRVSGNGCWTNPFDRESISRPFAISRYFVVKAILASKAIKSILDTILIPN